MKSMNEIRRNQRAVQETRQITNAMYLLSTSRMKKAMSQIGYNQIYMRRIRAAVKDVLEKSQGAHHRYLDFTHSGRAAFVVMASDKGMCGAYNANVIHLAGGKLYRIYESVCDYGGNLCDKNAPDAGHLGTPRMAWRLTTAVYLLCQANWGESCGAVPGRDCRRGLCHLYTLL